MQIHCAHTDIIPIDSLIENPKNPNKHPQKQIELLAKIMKQQGWRNPNGTSTAKEAKRERLYCNKRAMEKI